MRPFSGGRPTKLTAIMPDVRMTRAIKRILLLIPDVSTLGGVQIRTLKTMRHAPSRDVVYECLTRKSRGRGDHIADIRSRVMVYEDERNRVLDTLSRWSPADTAIFFSSNTLRGADRELRTLLDRFPLIYIGSGQLAFHLQDSKALRDRQYRENLRVTKVVLLSELDKLTYNQFGRYGQIVGFNPVELRSINSYSLEKNKYVGYVGRIEFRARGAERLIDVAKALRRIGRGPLKVFTVSASKNSPQLAEFQTLIAEQGCEDDIDMVFDVTDLDRIFSEIGILVVPSKKEAFGNAILEAYSYGVPVISAAYAPGPSALIEHDRTGLLIDRFDTDALAETFESLSDQRRLAMSSRAFQKHKDYGMDRYFDHLETVAEEALGDFRGENTVKVYPDVEFLDVPPRKKAKKRWKKPMKTGMKTLQRAVALCQLALPGGRR